MSGKRRSRVKFTEEQVVRAIKEAQALGSQVTAVRISPEGVIELEQRPASTAEQQAWFETENPYVGPEEAIELSLCKSEAQFRLLVKEGILPAATRGKWERRGLKAAVTAALIKSDSPSLYHEIYFLELGDYIKIGFSTGVYSRIASMQTGSPYEIKLIGTIRGSMRNEEELHHKMAHLRHRGEWFKRTKGLLAYVDWLMANQVMP